jgi:selenium metabolism protein YedF
MKIVDTKGQVCPAPLIAARKVLKETAAGESFVVITDNKTSFDNLCRYLKDNKAAINSSEAGGVWTLTVTKSVNDLVKTDVEEYCAPSNSHFQKGKFIVVISSDKMGEGEDELGYLLMINFIKALKDLDQLPARMVFYNSGVKLATKSSQAIEHLRDLEKMGVELMLCATCVNFYCLDTVIGTGIVSNMFSIAEAMASADKILRP